MSEIDFLLYSNATRVGNLDFRNSPDSPEPEMRPPEFDELANILQAAEIVNEIKDIFLNWKESFEESGLSVKEIDIIEPSIGLER